MNIETVEYKVKKIIADQFGILVDGVSTNDDLKEFNIDSLDIVELVMKIEDVFKIEIESEDGLDTVDKIIALVEAKLAEK